VHAQGWEWADEDWKIDMAGLEEGAVDEEGWSYAVDFNWFKIPPPPGAGKFRRVRGPGRLGSGRDPPGRCRRSCARCTPVDSPYHLSVPSLRVLPVRYGLMCGAACL